MAQYIAYPTKVGIEPSNATVTNRDNIFDANDSTYGVIDVNTNKYSDFMITGFDFSSIPAGATINSVKLECRAKVENASYVKMYVIACRKYTNGSYTSMGTSYDDVWFNNTSVATNTFSGTRIGTWTRDELASWSSANPDDPYTGIAFYFRLKNSYALGARSATIYYFKVIVDATIPNYTLTVNATEGGTVTGGGTYESGKTATLTATAKDGYTFVSWNDGNGDETRTVTVTGNATYTATFAKIETSKAYCGTKKVSVYCGTKKVSVYIGTQKLI